MVSIVSILDKGYNAINGLIWPSEAVLSSIVFWHSIRTNSGHSLVYSQTDKAPWYQRKSIPTLLVCLDKTAEYNEQNWARFLSLAPSKLRLCSANHRTGCSDWAQSELTQSKRQKTGPVVILMNFLSLVAQEAAILRTTSAPSDDYFKNDDILVSVCH